MTDVATQRQTFREAVEILVQREVDLARPTNPGAYAGSVRARLMNDKRDLARAILEEESMTPSDLAEVLDDTPTPPPAPKPTVRHVDERGGCPTCGCYGGGGWLEAKEPRNDLGVTPDIEPCPTCAPDRRRVWERHDRDERAELHERQANGIRHHRIKYAAETSTA